jgi:hypothetical protein
MPPPGNHRHAGYERRNERSIREHAQGLMPWRAIGLGLAIPAFGLSPHASGRRAVYSTFINGREPRRRSMTRTINNRRRNQKNRHKLAALAKKVKKERNQLG